MTCCRCNKTGRCRNCSCVKTGSQCLSCRLGQCSNGNVSTPQRPDAKNGPTVSSPNHSTQPPFTPHNLHARHNQHLNRQALVMLNPTKSQTFQHSSQWQVQHLSGEIWIVALLHLRGDCALEKKQFSCTVWERRKRFCRGAVSSISCLCRGVCTRMHSNESYHRCIHSTPTETPKDHISSLTRRMILWKDGDFIELMKEGKTLQQRLKKPRSSHDNEQRLSRSFANLMFKGKTKSALQLLSNHGKGGVLHLEDMVPSSSSEQTSVLEALKSKHPPGLCIGHPQPRRSPQRLSSLTR